MRELKRQFSEMLDSADLNLLGRIVLAPVAAAGVLGFAIFYLIFRRKA